jgi:TRAP-type C4-dicarboxylate transport system permease small subunit
MTGVPSSGSGLWHSAVALYSRLLSFLLVVSVAILVIPVSLQIFSRYTELIPSYIWTEEMARFLFIWMIMIGAMIGVRESTHFEIDLWPAMNRRMEAALKLLGQIAVLVFAVIFVWSGYEFTAFAWYRISELAELPLWLIHMAWPITGVTWVIFLGEHMAANLRTIFGRSA